MAVLTHKGRSADSGHYVAWVKQDDKQWIQFDDDELIPRKEVSTSSCAPRTGFFASHCCEVACSLQLTGSVPALAGGGDGIIRRRRLAHGLPAAV